MLKVSQLTKRFHLTTAVDQVSFKVKKGEIFSLIGPNGSGKTTIIKIVAGLWQPTSGQVWVGGKEVTQEPAATKAKIGYIPDEPHIWSMMTGEEFIKFTATLYGLSQEVQAEKMPNLLSVFNLRGTEKGYFENYSRGNKQKFTIITALMHEPKLLLIDEPIVGLDPQSAAVAIEKFREFAAGGGSILLATHTLPIAQELSTRIGVLKEGQLVTTGSLVELRAQAGLKEDASLEEIYGRLTR